MVNTSPNVRLWDPFQMAVSWLGKMGVILTYLLSGGDPPRCPPSALVLMGIISPLGFRRPMPIAITLASGGMVVPWPLACKTPENTKTWNSKQPV